MNKQINGYRGAYFVFSFFISCFIVFSLHKGFQPIDIITIPVFAVLLFLIIDFSAQYVYRRNLENFVTENFINHKSAELSEADIREQFTSEEASPSEESTFPLPTSLIPQEERVTTSLLPFMEEERVTTSLLPSMEEERVTTSLLPSMEEERVTTSLIPSMEEERVTTSLIPSMEEERVTTSLIPSMEEERVTTSLLPSMEEEMPKPPLMPEEEEEQIITKSPTPSNAKKVAKAKSHERKRPNINRYHMDDCNSGVINENLGKGNPININVSYNNNTKPISVESNFEIEEKIKDINRYRFDDGHQKKNTPTNPASLETTTRSTLASPVNNTTVNAALSNMNQKYYPAYLENPLNKDQPGTSIGSIFNSEEYENDLKKQEKYNQRANREILLRKKPHWTQSNYEANMMNKILNEKNSPAPVLLNSVWSEWKPTD